MNEHSMNTAAASDNNAASLGLQGEPGADLFVINLCASMTPMPSMPKHLTGFESHKLYQVSKMEDGRRRYRLRLGFFTSEADAELIVGSIRNLYPAAFTSCLSNEDLRYVEGFAIRAKPVIKSVEAPPAKPEMVTTAPAPVKASAPVPKAPMSQPSPAATIQTKPLAPKSAPASSSTVPAAPAQRVEQKKPTEAELSLEIDLRGTAESAALPTEPTPKAEVVPFHVGRGVKVPEVSLELEVDSATTPSKDIPVVQQTAPRAPAPPPAKAASPAKPMTAAKAPPAMREPLPPPPQITDYIPVLDTTLTLRTLTQAEIDDPNQPKWFVVQLAQSEHPVNLEAMPKLDIFSAYSLYSVAVTEAGTIRHALRLGFFREDVSAEAVSGYLKTFFADPTVKRVSAAEHMRFSEPPRRTEATAESSGDKIVQLKLAAAPAKSSAMPAKPAAKSPARPASGAPSPYAKVAKTTQIAKPAVKTRPGTKSLSQELKEEARQTLLSESGIRKAPKPQSFLSRLIGKSLD